MDNFWIIGGGKFGLRAAQVLRKINSTNIITIVEKQKAVCRQLAHLGFEGVCTDGVKYLKQHLNSRNESDWIIPAIPLHVAFEWIRAKMSARHRIKDINIPTDLVSVLPNPIPGETGQLFISIADFKCPPNCSEPDDICTYTGKSRPMILHEFLKSIQFKDFASVVIRSHQLAPGVGGYRPAALFDAFSQIRDMQAPVLLSTACSCHGVMNAFSLKPIQAFRKINH
ncbi:MAG: NAD-binding protein [Desulfobacterales bacterium]|jgi:hypothetical protein